MFLDSFQHAEHQHLKLFQLIDDDGASYSENSACVNEFEHLKLPSLESEPEQNHSKVADCPVAAALGKESFTVFDSRSSHSEALQVQSPAMLLPDAYVYSPPLSSPLSATDDMSCFTGNKQENCSTSKTTFCSPTTLVSPDDMRSPKDSRALIDPRDRLDCMVETLEFQERKKLKFSKGNVQVNCQRKTHIAVERNRRKQMNENLAILRSLMPGSYVQRNDQASIIGGVIEFIKELEQLLQVLEGQKQRKTYTEAVSPRSSLSPRQSPSPRASPSIRSTIPHKTAATTSFMGGAANLNSQRLTVT
eukprot:c2302_g1_i2 orf=125-1039(+)